MNKTSRIRWMFGLAASACLAIVPAHAQEPVGEVELIEYWDFESDTDGVVTGSWAGHTGVLGGDAVLTDGGMFGNALDTSALNGSCFLINGSEDDGGDGEKGFVEAVNAKAAGPDVDNPIDQLSVVFWQRNTDALRDQVAWWMVSPSSGGSERGAQGHTPWSNDQVYFDSAGCCDAGTQRINAPSGVADWMAWNHFAFVKNGENKAIWVNGEIVVEGTNTSPLPNDIDRMYFGNGIEKNRDQPGLMDELGVIAGALSEEQIKALADGATVIEIFDDSEPGINLNAGQTLNAGILPALTSDQELKFTIKNTGKNVDFPLDVSFEIVSGDTDKFTSVTFPQEPIGAGDPGDVVFTFNNNGAFGAFTATVNVKTNDADAEDQDFDITVRAAVLNPVGPAAHFRFDEADGSVAGDSTAFGRNGTYTNNAGSVTLGQAGLNANTGSSVAVADGGEVIVPGGAFDFTGGFTWSLWIQPASLGDGDSADYRTIIGSGEVASPNGIWERNGDLEYFTAAPVFSTSLAEADKLVPGEWYHVAVRWDAGMATIFVDGVEAASGAVDFTAGGDLFIGAFGPGALGFAGNIDDVQIFDIPLENDLITFLYENPPQEPTPSGGVDSDGDDLLDDDEVTIHGTNPQNPDSDGDGLNDGEEINTYETDALNPDTDGDGFLDGFEVANGFDPKNGDEPKADDFLELQYDFEEGEGTSVANGGKMGGPGTLMNPANGEWRASGSPSKTGPGYLYFGAEGGGATAMHVATGLGADELGIAGENDYTMMAWVNFDNASDDRMVFGQAVDDNVLHHGSRAGQYYMAHWGNDLGAGAVEVGAWHHVAFVYGSGVQTIYVDGDPVGSAARGPLTVTEEIVIGTTRAGEAEVRDMVGCIDEARVYSIALPGLAIKQINGASEDSDGDGIFDPIELALFGNLDQDKSGDFDNDGLTNGEEIDNTGTKANVADTDGDGINDGDELAGNPSTDPLLADTDKDGLNDGAELAAGTDPTNRDSDGDGFGDGFEVLRGSNPLDPNSPGSGGGEIVFYETDFTAADDTIDLGDGSIFQDNVDPDVAKVVGNAGQLTLDGVASTLASFKTPIWPAGPESGFVVSVDVALSGGGDRPADGFAFGFGPIADNAEFSEEGPGTGLAVEFDTWDNEGEGADNGIGVDISLDGADVAITREAAGADPLDNQFYQFDGVFRTIEIEFVPNDGGGGTITVVYGGNVLHDAVAVDWSPAAGDRLAIGARTGGATETLVIDDLKVFQRGGDSNPFQLLAYWDFNDADTPAVALDKFGGVIGNISGAAYSPDAGGLSGQAGDYAMRGTAGQVIVEDASFLNAAGEVDQITFSFWQNLDSAPNSSTFWATAEGEGGDRAAQGHVPWGGGTIFFDTTGCCDPPQRISGPPTDGHDFLDGWNHYAFVKDGENKSVWVNGVLAIEGAGAAPLLESFTALYISGEPNGNNLIDGVVDEFAVFGFALPENIIQELAAGAPADGFGGGGSGSLSPNLVGYWPMDDPADAATAEDVTGVHHGTVGAGITFGEAGANGSTGTAARFTGAGGIQADWTQELNPESFTFTAWANIENTADWNSVVTSREDNGTSVNGLILYNSPEGQWDFWTGAGGAPGAWQRTTGSEAVTNEWTHLAITYDQASDTKILYVNGVEDARAEGQGYVPNGTTEETQRPFNIGAGQDFGDGFFFTGLIDDVSMWDIALAAGDIPAIMANGVEAFARGGTPPPPPVEVPVLTVAAGPDSAGISFMGLPGKTYDIQYSADLLTWEDIPGQTGLSGDINYEDTDAGRRALGIGFYRAVQN